MSCFTLSDSPFLGQGFPHNDGFSHQGGIVSDVLLPLLCLSSGTPILRVSSMCTVWLSTQSFSSPTRYLTACWVSLCSSPQSAIRQSKLCFSLQSVIRQSKKLRYPETKMRLRVWSSKWLHERNDAAYLSIECSHNAKAGGFLDFVEGLDGVRDSLGKHLRDDIRVLSWLV